MSMVPDEMRGRALGLLTLAIGAAPFGCAALGELAESLGARPALRAFSLAGCAAQLLWLSVRPQSLRIRRPN